MGTPRRTVERRFGARVVPLLAGVGLALLPATARAIPVLQIYVEGSTYDGGSETWVFAGSGTTRLWVIGNVRGPGGAGAILDVSLVVAYPEAETGSVTFTPTTASLLPDLSIPSLPVLDLAGIDSSPPYDGRPLPSHGVYGPGTAWFRYRLGSFDRTDSPTGDFISSYPSVLYAGTGEIKAYAVSLAGFSAVHFDAYGRLPGGTGKRVRDRSVFAPFSHDAEIHDLSEPDLLPLLGAALAGLAVLGRIHRGQPDPFARARAQRRGTPVRRRTGLG